MAHHSKIQEALDARDALASALTQAGIQLPAMDVRRPWADADADADAETDEEGTNEKRYALIHLGVCSAPVAVLLAAVIMRGLPSRRTRHRPSDRPSTTRPATRSVR